MSNETFETLVLPLLSTGNPDYLKLYNYFQKSNLDTANTIELLKIGYPNFFTSQILLNKLNRIEYLKDKFMVDFMEDLLYKYVISDLKNGFPVDVITKLRKESFIGYTLEAFMVRKISDDIVVKKNVYKWAMCQSKLPTDDNIINIQAVGRGSIFCRKYLPDEYNEQSKMDIVLIEKIEEKYRIIYNDFLGRCAEIQVKAVRSNSQIQNISGAITNYIFSTIYRDSLSHDQIMSTCYRNTLTLLLDKNSVHTKTRVIESATRILQKRGVSFDLEALIKSPQDIGIDQNEINEYYDFLSYFYDHPNEFKISMIDENLKNSLLFTSLTKNEPFYGYGNKTRNRRVIL